MLEKLVVLIVFRLLRIKGRNLFIKCVPPSGVKNMNKDEYRPPLTFTLQPADFHDGRMSIAD